MSTFEWRPTVCLGFIACDCMFMHVWEESRAKDETRGNNKLLHTYVHTLFFTGSMSGG